MERSFRVALLTSLALLAVACDSPGGGGGSDLNQFTGSTALDSEEASFLTLINSYRAQNGAGPLVVVTQLEESATWMSNDMAAHSYLDHTDSIGRDPFTRMEAFGYDCTNAICGENIAAGYQDAQSTFNQWTSDSAHKANMLDPDYKAIGIGRAYNAGAQYGWYWTTDFGSVVP